MVLLDFSPFESISQWNASITPMPSTAIALR